MTDQRPESERQAQAALHPGEEEARRQATILAKVTDGVNVVSALDGRIVYNNPAFEAMFGYAPGELIGQPVAVLNAPEAGSPEAMAQAIMATLHETGRWDGELLNRRKDGSIFPTYSTITCHDLPGWGLVYLGIQRDITARQQAEQAIAASEALLRTLAEAIPSPIFVINRDHTWRYLNPAALVATQAMHGCDLTLERIQGNTALETFGDDASVRDRMAQDEQVMANGILEQSEIGVPDPEGERTLLVNRVPLRDAEGEVIGMVGVAHDITTQKRAEAQHLADLARQRDALVQEAHHRIKNHLQGIVGLLRMEANAHPDLAPYLDNVVGQIGAIAGVYGLQGAGESNADLDRLVQVIATGAAEPVAYQGTAGGALPLNERDAVPVALVVNELITNALKHREGSDPARPVRVTLERTGEEVLLTVNARPGRLPAGFDFAARRGLGAGLELVATLLPSQGASLAFFQEDDTVRAELRLQAPVIREA